MTFWSLSALIWFKNMKKMLLQMTSGFLQLESTLLTLIQDGNHDDKVRITFFFFKLTDNDGQNFLAGIVLCRPKNFGRHCLSIQKKIIVIRTLLSS
jgi:hypothetical protein